MFVIYIYRGLYDYFYIMFVYLYMICIDIV